MKKSWWLVKLAIFGKRSHDELQRIYPLVMTNIAIENGNL